MNSHELIEGLNKMRDLMVSVSTGGSRILEVDEQYQRTYAKTSAALAVRKITNPITYGSLWDWYGRWSSGDLPSYQSRRSFVSNLFTPLINLIQTGKEQEYQLTGWERVDRTVGEVRNRLASAENEEQFQAVGLLCRDGLVSLAQAVYIRANHPPLDGTEPSSTVSDTRSAIDWNSSEESELIISDIYDGATKFTEAGCQRPGADTCGTT